MTAPGIESHRIAFVRIYRDTRRPREHDSAMPATLTAPQQSKNAPAWYTPSEAADRLRTSTRYVYSLIEAGALRAYRLGDGPRPRLRVKAVDVDNLLLDATEGDGS